MRVCHAVQMIPTAPSEESWWPSTTVLDSGQLDIAYREATVTIFGIGASGTRYIAASCPF